MPPIPFWFLRHGETEWNREGRSQGRTDVPLNARGVAQAQAAARLLRMRGIAGIASSPLVRARATAEAVGAACGLPVTLIDGLQEVSFGANEGRVMGEAWFEEWIAGGPPPEGGESMLALRARAVGAVTQALALPPPVLVVAHGALFRALRIEMGLSPAARLANCVPVFCEPGTPWSLTPLA